MFETGWLYLRLRLMMRADLDPALWWEPRRQVLLFSGFHLMLAGVPHNSCPRPCHLQILQGYTEDQIEVRTCFVVSRRVTMGKLRRGRISDA